MNKTIYSHPLWSVGAIAILGILVMRKLGHRHHHRCVYESLWKDLDHKFKETKAALDKATQLVVHALNHTN